MTRLNGIPIQMLATITETSDHCGEVSQLTGPTPTSPSAVLRMPESLLSIHDHVDADTISGSSQGTRNIARSVAANRKCCRKNTANAGPIVYWKGIDAPVNTAVWASAGRNVGSLSTTP